MKKKRCGECGSKEVSLIDQKGKPFPWKDYPAVFLAGDLKVLECELCHNLILSGSDVKKLSTVLVQSVSKNTMTFIETVLMREKCTQVELATRLGVTPEYLSEIKSGRKQPSFQTYNFLKTLASDPKSFAVSDPNYAGEQKKAI
jgi:DNA-binding transcriptional regulator YiaG